MRPFLVRQPTTERIGHLYGRRICYIRLSVFKVGGSFQAEEYRYPETGRLSVSKILLHFDWG